MKWYPLAIASLYASAAAVWSLVLGFHLSPDTWEYAHGRASWSSLVAAGGGYVGGFVGVAAVSIAGAAVLGYLLARHAWRWWVPLALWLCPAWWYVMEPSADAIGAASVVLLWLYVRSRRERWLALPAAAAFHAVAALCLCVCTAASHRRRLVRLAAGAAAGGLACLLMVHVQARYFVPGLALATLRKG